MPTADEFFPGAARSSSYSENTHTHTSTSAVVVHFSVEENSILKLNMHTSMFLDNMRVMVWVTESLHKSAESQMVKFRPKWSKRGEKMKTIHESVFLSLFHSQTCLLISSSVSPLPAFYCLLKTTTANFAQTTLQWWPQISAGRRAGRQAGCLSWVVA